MTAARLGVSNRTWRSRTDPVAVFVLLTFLFIAPGRAVEPKREVYLINSKPASVAVVDSEHWKLAGNIPLDPNPTHALIHPQTRILYVLHNGLFSSSDSLPQEPSKLSILDPGARKLIRSIPLGWNAAKMHLLGDGRYLVCFGVGTPGFKRISQQPGSATVIDTRKNEAVATLSAGRLGSHLLFARDGSRVFVLSRGDAPDKKKGSPPHQPALTIFSLDQEKPLAEIELEHEAQDMLLSQDDKWLYLLDQGSASKDAKRNRNGVVHVVDVDAFKLIKTHTDQDS